MHTFTLSDRTSVLEAHYNPPIQLDGDYEIGLINFETYNAIPNVDVNNNFLKVGDKLIEIPVGSYEIADINAFIHSQLPANTNFHLYANNNTLKSIIKCDKEVDFGVGKSIGPLLGFSATKILRPINSPHISHEVVDILRVNTIKIDCNIVQGAFSNSTTAHTIHQFFPSVPPGFKIIETPQNVIYMPINTNTIDNIILKITDQDDRAINFRQEVVTIRLHLRSRPENNGS